MNVPYWNSIGKEYTKWKFSILDNIEVVKQKQKTSSTRCSEGKATEKRKTTLWLNPTDCCSVLAQQWGFNWKILCIMLEYSTLNILRVRERREQPFFTVPLTKSLLNSSRRFSLVVRCSDSTKTESWSCKLNFRTNFHFAYSFPIEFHPWSGFMQSGT